MSRAPAMPAEVSEKALGVRIWVRSEEMELKRPTRMANGRRRRWNVGFRSRRRRVVRREGGWWVEDAETGVGGREGTKKEGMVANVEMRAT